MKKILLSVLAVAALASCAKEEVISYDKSPIGFGNAFVDNATKAIYNSADAITKFTVFGNVKGTGTGASTNTVALYGDNGATVTRTENGNTADLGAAWYCDVVRYWTPSCEFNFAAVANGTATVGEDGLPTSISYTVKADDPADLIYATASATTNEKSEVTAGTNSSVTNGVVGFTFNHLLSMVTFNVDATKIAKNDYSVVVTDIVVTGAFKNGVYTIVDTNDSTKNLTWEKTDDSTVSQDYYENDKYVSHLLIPVEQSLGVTVSYNILFNDTVISSGTKTGKVTHTFETNCAYTITATLSALNEIQFSIEEVNGFTTPEQGGSVTIQ